MSTIIESNWSASSSLLNSLLALPDDERASLIARLSNEQALALKYDWEGVWARRNQLAPPGDWRIWLVLAGRGWGKTKTGAEWARYRAQRTPGGIFALIGQTAADVRDVMVRGPAGILACSPPDFYPTYSPSNRLLTWPNGAEAHTYSGDEPDQLRGPAHHGVWADEPAKWKYGPETWDNMEMGLRLGANPQAVATTTPRPIKLIKALIADPDCVVTPGSLFDNEENLPKAYVRRMRAKYEGTRLGQQELYAKVLDDNPLALWNRKRIEELRVTSFPPLVRVGVAVDPGVSEGEDAAETGIVAGGIGADGHGYILEDVSLQGSPHTWATAAAAAAFRHRADRIIAEKNQGGLMVESTIRAAGEHLPITLVHASRGKYVRAEPCAALYERGMVHHVGLFAELEDQLVEWVPGDDSPDRLDALVWLLTWLYHLDEEEPNPLEGVVMTAGIAGWMPK